jgi:hypothetical protein
LKTSATFAFPNASREPELGVRESHVGEPLRAEVHAVATPPVSESVTNLLAGLAPPTCAVTFSNAGDTVIEGEVTVNVTAIVAVAPPVVAVRVIVAVYVPPTKEPVAQLTVISVLPFAPRLPDVGLIDSQPDPDP